MAAYQIDHYMPAMQDDRPVGAVLAGLPTMPAPNEKGVFIGSTVNDISDPWIYDGVVTLMERGHGTFQVGQKSSPLTVGLRDHSMRTPGQFQQNFPRELAISEAAALAGADAIQFRHRPRQGRARRSACSKRSATRRDGKRAPRRIPKAASSGATPVRGQGVSVMFRSATYWACVSQIAVTPSTGAIKVEKVTVAVDPGIVVNPMQLKRQVEGGTVMGVSIALLEEAAVRRERDHQPRLAHLSDPEDGRYSRGQSRAPQPAGGRHLRRRIGSGQCAGRAGDRRGAL